MQGGEPPPCPRVALSPDRRVAFTKNVVFPIVALATGIFGDFSTFFRLTRPELGIFSTFSHSGHTVDPPVEFEPDNAKIFAGGTLFLPLVP